MGGLHAVRGRAIYGIDVDRAFPDSGSGQLARRGVRGALGPLARDGGWLLRRGWRGMMISTFAFAKSSVVVR